MFTFDFSQINLILPTNRPNTLFTRNEEKGTRKREIGIIIRLLLVWIFLYNGLIHVEENGWVKKQFNLDEAAQKL